MDTQSAFNLHKSYNHEKNFDKKNNKFIFEMFHWRSLNHVHNATKKNSTFWLSHKTKRVFIFIFIFI